MKRIISIFMVVGLLFGLSICVIYADSKDLPEGGKVIHLQYGDAYATDTTSPSGYIYGTNGICTNSRAIIAVYVRDKERKPMAQSSISGLNTATRAQWETKKNMAHIHTASSIIPR